MMNQPQKTRINRKLIWSLVLSVLAVLILLSLYFQNRDIPNPFWAVWNGTYSYQPPNGPPSADLMEMRPEAIFTQYIQDYIQVAGTYPCANSLQAYQHEGSYSYHPLDPMISGKPCTALKRIVTAVQIDRVDVAYRGGDAGVEGYTAKLTYRVTYAGGEQWLDHEYLSPAQGQAYWRAYLHLSCWSSPDTIAFYTGVEQIYHISTPNLQNSYECITAYLHQ